MTETLKNFERCCRLCAEEQEVTIMLFSAEASEMLLLEKLQKYLLIQVEENDKLSKNICIECCSKLRSLCEFIDLIRKAQEKLLSLSLKIEQLNSSTPTINAIKQEKTEITEICVDPMDILNASEETFPHLSLACYSDDIVTLKLIKQDDRNGNEEKKKYECDVCGKSFIVEQSLKNHSWIHIRDEDFSCFTCQRSFKFQADLDIHIKSHKQTGFRYNCDLCGRRFKTNYTYEVHMKIHKSAKAFTCTICNRSYANLTGLKIHNITHSPEKPFQCTVCDKKFKRNQELKFHMNHHTGNKPYECKYCDKSFASTGNLYSHRNRAHALGNKIFTQYECHICQKNCRRQENYVYHIYQHTGEKPYSCTECSIKFLTQRNLNSHYDNVHPNVIRPVLKLPIFCPIRSKWL